MNTRALVTSSSLLLLASPCFGAASTGQPFYGDPPDQHHPWAIHDHNRPQPKRVEPGTFSTPEQPGKPPSDAIVLFDGSEKSMANWESENRDGSSAGPTKWIVKDGAMECVPQSGYTRTKAHLGDVQLHVEWAAPSNVKGDSQGRGNSGIFLMGLFEVQVLDNYNNPTYADGFAGSVYGIMPPYANPLRAPGEFQVVDIIFRRPIQRDGKLIDPGYLTVFINGVLVQDHTPLEGPTTHLRRTATRAYPDKGPLKLQDHGNPVRFRNIWYRELPPRVSEGSTDGYLTAEAALAKRKQIAASLRADAAKLTNPTAQMLRLAESLTYEKDAAASEQVNGMAERYVAGLKGLSSAAIEQRKGEIQGVTRAFQYLGRHDLVPKTYAPTIALEKIADAQGWNEDQKAKKKKK